jgi:hypothetical protein
MPEDYAAFLRTCNGFAWNGIEYWGTDIVTEKGNDRFKLMDIVTMSDDWDERYYENHKTEMLYIGRADDDIYVYNCDEKQYEIRSMDAACGEVYDILSTFAEHFVFTVGGRLGYTDDPDELKYGHDEGKYDGEV